MAQVTKKKRTQQHVVLRGWGHEIWIENIPQYCGKLLVIRAGKRSSLHFHMNKIETMYIQSGGVTIEFIDPETGKPYDVHLGPGESVMIPAGQIHQIIGGDVDSELFEFSTLHEECDSYRVKKGD